MTTLILIVEYDGTNFSGWQVQDNVSNTVQAKIDEAIFYSCGQKYSSIGSGRTDTGVHSAGQVVSIKDFTSKIPLLKLKQVLNGFLPEDIRIKEVYETELAFNARIDAIQREYVYNLCIEQSVFNSRFSAYMKYKFDTEKLFDSAEIFIGEYDFTTFSKINESTKTYICDVIYSKWDEIDKYNYQFKIVANRFVYGMVRSIVGAMIDVGRGKRTKHELKEALLKQDRALASPFAPAKGLILNKVYYPEKFQYLNK